MKEEEDLTSVCTRAADRIRALTQTDLIAQICFFSFSTCAASPLGFLYWRSWSSWVSQGDWKEAFEMNDVKYFCSHFRWGNNALCLIILIKITRQPLQQGCDETNLLRNQRCVCYLCHFCLLFWAFGAKSRHNSTRHNAFRSDRGNMMLRNSLHAYSWSCARPSFMCFQNISLLTHVSFYSKDYICKEGRRTTSLWKGRGN